MITHSMPPGVLKLVTRVAVMDNGRIIATGRHEELLQSCPIYRQAYYARIHVDNISHVINFDLPYEVESYVHRIGRTGRAGTAGKAISLACEYGAYIVPDLEEFIEFSPAAGLSGSMGLFG